MKKEYITLEAILKNISENLSDLHGEYKSLTKHLQKFDKLVLNDVSASDRQKIVNMGGLSAAVCFSMQCELLTNDLGQLHSQIDKSVKMINLHKQIFRLMDKPPEEYTPRDMN